MKTIILCGLLALTGCVTIKGEYDPNLKSVDPYVFVYPDSTSAAIQKVKRVLYRAGWEIAVDDAGYLSTKQRDLPDDEYVDSKAFAAAMGGISQSWIRGSLYFEFADNTVSMRSQVIQDKTGEQLQSQGMPIMMKYRRLLEQQGFTLK
jgi:hypothetical protein